MHNVHYAQNVICFEYSELHYIRDDPLIEAKI